MSHESQAQTCLNGLSGTYKIGPTGTFTSIKRAWDSLSVKGVSGPVLLELQASYNSGVETFPLKLTRIPCSDTLRRITLRPETGASGLVINSAHDTATLELSSINGLIIDGRPGGTGSSIQLKISNTSFSGNALRYLHGASNTILRFVECTGSNTSSFNGVIQMGWSDSLTGNLNNLIDSSSIHSGTLPAANLIWAQGYPDRKNRNFRIRNSRLYDYYLRNGSSAAIHIANANDSMEISGNQIYQTTTRDYASFGSFNMISAIRINTVGEGSHQVKNNTIGGSGPGASGAKMRLTGNYNFKGIYIYNASGTARASLVENNTLSNLYFESNDGMTLGLSLIHLGYYDISAIYSFNGFCRNNKIGSTDTSQSIIHRSLRSSTSGSRFTGIDAAGLSSNDSSSITGNGIGGVYIMETSTAPVQVNGICLGSNSPFGTFRCLVDNNLIGSTTLTNSIWNYSGHYVYGLYLNGAANNANLKISNNTIANLTESSLNTNTGTGSVAGIYMLNGYIGSITIEKNKIHHLQAGKVGFPDVNYSLAGIYFSHAGTQLTSLRITGNEVYSLFTGNYSNSSQFQVAGIQLKSNNAARLNSTVSRNRIHSISGVTAPPSLFAPRYSGILLDMDTLTIQVDNNMISLGMYERNTQNDDNGTYYGIQEYWAGKTVLLHNTVFMGGRSFGTESAAYVSFGPAATKRYLYNNILVTQRTNKSDNLKTHALIAFYPRTLGALNYNSDHNAYFFSTVNGKIGDYGTTAAITTLSDWKTSTGKDSSTIFGNPTFNSDTSAVPQPDLHIQSPTIIEGRGNSGMTTLTDFDGDTRALLSPVDIGADAGNFLAIEPQKAATGLGFTNVTNTAATLNVTAGDGTNRLFVIRRATAVSALPVDGQGYSANPAFGTGSDIGSSTFVVGNANQSVTVTGLLAGTTYHVSVFEYNGQQTSSNYLTTTAPSGSFTTSGVTGIVELNIPGLKAQVFPNPGKQFLLHLESNRALNGQYRITDMQGRLLFNGTLLLKPGTNDYPLKSIDNAVPGNYILTLEFGQKKAAILLVRQ